MANFDDFFNGISKPVAAAMDADVLTAAQAYADSVAQGLDFRPSCRVVTIASLPAYTRTENVLNANAKGALPTIDGVALQVGDSICLKNGASGADNWIYTVNLLGGAGSKWKMTRRADSDSDAKVTSGNCVEISEGSKAGTAWYISTADPITLNTTSLTIAQWSGKVSTDGTLAGATDSQVPSALAAKTYADSGDAATVITAAADATSKANTAQSNAISTASGDATTKANAAQAAAIAASLSLHATADNAAAINDGVVSTTAKLAVQVVTVAKMFASATARFLGRITAGSGAVEELTAAQMKSALAYYTSGDTFIGNLTGNASGSSGSCTGDAGGLAAGALLAGAVRLASAFSAVTASPGAGWPYVLSSSASCALIVLGSGTRHVTLPTFPLSSAIDGILIVIKEAQGNAAANNVIIDRGGAVDLIDGATSKTIATPAGVVILLGFYDAGNARGNWSVLTAF